MSQACNSIITSGFDIVLSDKISYHFSLELSDQVKISKLADRAKSGIEPLPWHADDGLYKFYPKEDILSINEAMEVLVEYHTTYFNSLKNYIRNLADVEKILELTYGVEIPVEYRSEVLTMMMNQAEGKK